MICFDKHFPSTSLKNPSNYLSRQTSEKCECVYKVNLQIVQNRFVYYFSSHQIKDQINKLKPTIFFYLPSCLIVTWSDAPPISLQPLYSKNLFFYRLLLQFKAFALIFKKSIIYSNPQTKPYFFFFYFIFFPPKPNLIMILFFFCSATVDLILNESIHLWIETLWSII